MEKDVPFSDILVKIVSAGKGNKKGRIDEGKSIRPAIEPVSADQYDERLHRLPT